MLFLRDKRLHLAVGFLGVLLSFALCWQFVPVRDLTVGVLLGIACRLSTTSVGWLKEAWDEAHPGHFAASLDAEVTKAGSDLALCLVIFYLIFTYA